MAGYIGNVLNDFDNKIVNDYFTGDGTKTVFTLSYAPPSEQSLLINIDRQIQLSDGTDYTVVGVNITFNTPPANNSNIVVRYMNRGSAILNPEKSPNDTDGGSASSIFLAQQSINGGTANG